MTVKLQKELMEQTRSRDDGSTTEAPPEAQAVEQAEESAVNLVGGVKERTGDGFSKAVRHGKQPRREKQTPRQRPAPTMDGAPPPAESAAKPPPPPQERMKRKATGNMRTRRAEAGRTPPAPKERPAPKIVHERPKQTADKDRQTEIREKSYLPKEYEQAAPRHERMTASASAPENTTAPPTAQERMREKAVADIRERRAEQYRPSAPHIEPKAAPATPSAHIPEKKDISLENQSINPINPVKERPRRAAKPKEKPAGGAFTPKTRQSAGKIPGTRTAPTVAKGKATPQQAAARAMLRVQRNAQRKLLRQTNQRTAKRAADLSRRAATAIVKAVASMVSAIAGLAGGVVLIPVIIVIILV